VSGVSPVSAPPLAREEASLIEKETLTLTVINQNHKSQMTNLKQITMTKIPISKRDFISIGHCLSQIREPYFHPGTQVLKREEI
jgi:hypothetical protein